MFAGGQVGKTAPRVAPDPRDLRLPREALVKNGAPYAVPHEFWDARKRRLLHLDESPRMTGIFRNFPTNFLPTVLSIGGLGNAPRNVIDFLTHPFDYARGESERNLLLAEHPKDYTLMDRDWAKAQNIGALITVLAATASMVWSGSKNVDGSGRAPIFVKRDPITGQREMGVLPLNLVMNSIFLMGGSLAAQHRVLQEEGHSSAAAYFLAANPVTGWNYTLFDRDHAFVDYVHADFAASAIDQLYSQYTARLTGILAVSSYAGIWPKDILPVMQTLIEERYFSLVEARAEYITVTEELSQLRATQPVATTSQSLVRALREHRAKLVELEGRLKALEGKINGLEAWVTNFEKVTGKRLTISVSGQPGLDQATATLERTKESLRVLEERKAQLQSQIQRTRDVNRRKRLIHALRNYYEPHAEALKFKRDKLVERIRGFLKDPRSSIAKVTQLTEADVREFARRARALWEREERAASFAVETLEEARNRRLVLTPEEEVMLEGRGKLRRFAYGARTRFFGDRWRVRATSYGSSVLMRYGESILVYHYMWNKSWTEAMRSGASCFLTLASNEPWIAGLKAAGVQKIPVVMQYLPSTTIVNGYWSVTQWDRDIMLRRCQAERVNLLHSQNSEYRAAIRARVDRWYRMATDQEKEMWDKPVDEGGCGMAKPST